MPVFTPEPCTPGPPARSIFAPAVSVGYNLFKNAWVSAGYNFSGFEDADFSEADYTAQGPFVTFRVKFDQQSVKEMIDWFSK